MLNHEMMILFVDNCSQESYLADVSIRCSIRLKFLVNSYKENHHFIATGATA